MGWTNQRVGLYVPSHISLNHSQILRSSILRSIVNEPASNKEDRIQRKIGHLEIFRAFKSLQRNKSMHLENERGILSETWIIKKFFFQKVLLSPFHRFKNWNWQCRTSSYMYRVLQRHVQTKWKLLRLTKQDLGDASSSARGQIFQGPLKSLCL